MRLLIIDDDAQLVRVLERLLTIDGHTVRTTSDPDEALRLLERGDVFEAVLCDLHMPDVSGVDFLKRVPERYSDKVVLMSGGFREEALRQCDGARLLDKPFTVEELYSTLAIGAAHVTGE